MFVASGVLVSGRKVVEKPRDKMFDMAYIVSMI